MTSLEILFNQESEFQGFTSASFWDSLAWQRNPTHAELFDDLIIQQVEDNFNQFCMKCYPCPPAHYLNPPLNYSIPPLIHFIWLGSSIPSRVNTVIASWKKYHPHWKIMIWTDREVERFSWSTDRLHRAFEQAKTWAEKSDILRFEILYQWGGIYSDTDGVCLKSFHDLMTNGLTFFAGIEVNYKIRSYPFLLYTASGLMGAKKGSSIIKYCLDHYKTEEEAPTAKLVMRAGPGLVSRACCAALTSFPQENLLILPCSYFYPLPYEDKGIDTEKILNFIAPESMAVHLWDGSWL